MHRQSLGSPNSKLHTHNGSENSSKKQEELTIQDKNRKEQASPPVAVADDERKSQKAQKSPEKLIHFIPMLIVLCFLILYLSSHDPSKTDLTNFNGFKQIQKPLDISSEIDDIGGLLEIEKSDVLAIRSSRNLQEIHKQRRHRKIAHF